jgi:hypothetical protein
MLREVAADPARTEEFFTAMAGYRAPRGPHDGAESVSARRTAEPAGR